MVNIFLLGILRGCPKALQNTLLKLLRNFIEIILWHECSPVNLLHAFRTPFTKNTSERLLLCLHHISYKTDSASS